MALMLGERHSPQVLAGRGCRDAGRASWPVAVRDTFSSAICVTKRTHQRRLLKLLLQQRIWDLGAFTGDMCEAT